LIKIFGVYEKGSNLLLFFLGINRSKIVLMKWMVVFLFLGSVNLFASGANTGSKIVIEFLRLNGPSGQVIKSSLECGEKNCTYITTQQKKKIARQRVEELLMRLHRAEDVDEHLARFIVKEYRQGKERTFKFALPSHKYHVLQLCLQLERTAAQVAL
jgi:hypothetical protein